MRHARTLSLMMTGIVATTAFSAAVASNHARAQPGLLAELTDAEALASMADGPADLASAIAIAQEATRMQAGMAGLEWVMTPAAHAYASPLGAVAVLAARHHVALDATTASSLAALDGPVADALTDLVAAMLALEDANTVAFAAADPAAFEAPTTVPDLAAALQRTGIRPAGILPVRNDLLDAVLDLSEALLDGVRDALPTIDLSPALVIHGSDECVDDTYTVDIVLLVDVCGNDRYDNNAGGGFGMAAALIDYDGDDLYWKDSAPLLEHGGLNGGGQAGTGFLVDEAGNDVYLGPDDGVNGGAFGGVGFLLDSAGDDVYDTGHWGWGTNGGGYFAGLAMLIDRSGSDFYRGSSDAVNGGSEGGVGFLYDGAGNDVFDATSGGTNGGASTGRGRLIDASGDDVYVAGGVGANGGSLGGLGSLWDGAGHDLYHDNEGGSGWDVTVFPKGNAGVQWDEPA